MVKENKKRVEMGDSDMISELKAKA